MEFHHVGVVVPNIKNSLSAIRKFLEFDEISFPTNIGSQKVNVCFLKLGNFRLEFIESVENDSPVYEFAQKGGGIHHLCFEVDDIRKTINKMEEQGAKVVVEPVKGFEDRLIAFLFLNMKNTNCNLIELAQKKEQ